MVSDMNIIIRCSLAIFVATCILPSAFVGGGDIKCQSCPEAPLQSPEKCSMSSFEKSCDDSICIALTAELTSGRSVGMLGCFNASAGNCTTSSACNQKNETLAGPEYFARCVAQCCTDENCNAYLFPTLDADFADTVKSRSPTSLGIRMSAFLYLPVFLWLHST